MKLYHITTRAAWAAARQAGIYRSPTLASEGFIHLSTEAQWRWVASTFYQGQQDLVLLALRQDLLEPAVRFEEVGGDRFLHLYGPLSLAAVEAEYTLSPSADGGFECLEGT